MVQKVELAHRTELHVFNAEMLTCGGHGSMVHTTFMAAADFPAVIDRHLYLLGHGCSVSKMKITEKLKVLIGSKNETRPCSSFVLKKILRLAMR